MPELTPSQREEIIRRRGCKSDGDGKVHRIDNLDIHHKDRNRNHNEPENLRVLAKKEHTELHRRAGY
jgi:hypothetical protein